MMLTGRSAWCTITALIVALDALGVLVYWSDCWKPLVGASAVRNGALIVALFGALVGGALRARGALLVGALGVP